MAITPCGCTQVLEPDPGTEFTVCDNAGAPAFTENGVAPIQIGANGLTVFFSTTKASINYSFIELDVENLVDPNPLQIDAELIERQLGFFRVALTGLPDTVNYQLRWNVYVRSI